ncbi:hypothetical protein M0811_13647 [Anaeramoeba ignava]|uniref:J domain-containing protein n=1 Tax=Anaeramoeba ignava TaxID=1746090 RepID=A0A9Q0R456_ANAIG|nr:hypothetical protein M0811_13647 [Anaeramoeba ignava]
MIIKIKNNNNNNINATNTPNDDPQKVIEIKKVLKKKCLYEVLEVEKTADLTQIKSSYRKLAMKFHPDRNKTTGSAEAFKKIGQAYSILSDETKRKRYDQFGDESEVNISTPTFRYRRNGDPRHYYYSEFGPEFNPFDLFDFFFEMQDYSSVRMQNRRRNHRQRRQPQQEESNIISLILRFSPFLLFFILILSTKLFETEETFSFTRQGNYVLKKETENLGIKYYVKKDFKTTTQGWINLEANVEYQYLSNLRQECQSDMFWNNNRKNIPPSCKEYYKYQKS